MADLSETIVSPAEAPVSKIYVSIVCRSSGVEYGVFGEAGEATQAAFEALDAEYAGAPGYTIERPTEPGGTDDEPARVAQKLAALTGSSVKPPVRRPYRYSRRAR